MKMTMMMHSYPIRHINLALRSLVSIQFVVASIIVNDIVALVTDLV